MRSMIIFLLFFLFVTTNCFSQEEIDVTNVTRLTILSPGISYEKRIGKRQTLKFNAVMALSAYWGDSEFFGSTSGIHFDPSLGIEYRYYYNGAARGSKGKRTERNSLNYFGAVHRSLFVKRQDYDTMYSKSDFRLFNTVGIVWGLQRNYHNRISLDLNAGLGYVYGKDLYQSTDWIQRLSTIISVELGFWLNKRK